VHAPQRLVPLPVERNPFLVAEPLPAEVVELRRVGEDAVEVEDEAVDGKALSVQRSALSNRAET
jgi:hypothetical protein